MKYHEKNVSKITSLFLVDVCIYLQLWLRHHLENMTHNPKRHFLMQVQKSSVVWMATLLLSVLTQAVWYCSLPFFFNNSGWNNRPKNGRPFFFSFFFLEANQPVMTPNLVPLEESFNHQTSFSLSFPVLCRKSHAPFCPQAWLQQPGQKAASS